MSHRLKKNLIYLSILILIIIFIVFVRRNNINESFVENLPIYRENSNRISKLNNSKTNLHITEPKKRFILFDCSTDLCGGWADRLKGIMSSYALALLTNRQLIIDITKPCDFLELLEPNIVNWNKNAYKLEGKTRNMVCIENYSCQKQFENANVSNFEPEYEIIKMQLNIDWLGYFSRAKNFQQRILDLGYTRDNFRLIYRMHEWYKKLFKLTSKLQIIYESFRENSKLTQNTTLICAQIRIGGQRDHVAFDVKFNELNSTVLWWKFIREHFLASLTNKNNWKLFVTSDHEQAEKDAVVFFGSQRVIRIPGFFTHVDREADLEDCTRVQKPILDFHFMQQCTYAAVSMSGFGKLATWNRDDPIKNMYVFLANKWQKANYDMTVMKSRTDNLDIKKNMGLID